MNGRVALTFKKTRIYVVVRDNKFVCAQLPGDLTNISDKLTVEEKKILLTKALSKLMKKEDAELI